MACTCSTARRTGASISCSSSGPAAGRWSKATAAPRPTANSRRCRPPHFPYQDYGIELWNAKQYAAAKAPEPRGLEGPVVWRLVTDSPEGVAALEFYRKLATQKWLRCYGDDGKVASCFDITPEMERSGVAVCPATGKRFDLNDPAVRSRVYHGIAKVRSPERLAQRALPGGHEHPDHLGRDRDRLVAVGG